MPFPRCPLTSDSPHYTTPSIVSQSKSWYNIVASEQMVEKEDHVTPRQRVLTALKRGQPDRVPKAANFYSVHPPEIAPQTAEEYFQCEVRFVEFSPPETQQDFFSYLKNLPPDVHMGSLSILRAYHEWDYRPELGERRPLSHARTPADLEDYCFPDVTDPQRYAGLRDRVHNYHARGLAVVGAPPHLGGELLEQAWRLRGFEGFFTDLVVNKELAHYLLDQLTDMIVHNCLVLTEAGIDILALDDDIGEPTRMLISPTMWREFFKPRMAHVIRIVRQANPDIVIFYHSDGYIEPIIGDLIEIGVDVLNPVQPDVMGPTAIKARYGDRLAFWGTVGTQTLWSWGGPEDIKAEVKHRIETVGAGGGLLISPAYDLEPAVPWENIVAFFEAVEEFGAY